MSSTATHAAASPPLPAPARPARMRQKGPGRAALDFRERGVPRAGFGRDAHARSATRVTLSPSKADRGAQFSGLWLLRSPEAFVAAHPPASPGEGIPGLGSICVFLTLPSEQPSGGSRLGHVHSFEGPEHEGPCCWPREAAPAGRLREPGWPRPAPAGRPRQRVEACRLLDRIGQSRRPHRRRARSGSQAMTMLLVMRRRCTSRMRFSRIR